MIKELFNSKFFLSLISSILCMCFLCEQHYCVTFSWLYETSDFSLNKILILFIFFHIISFASTSIEEMKEMLLPVMCFFNIIGVITVLYVKFVQ
jgi:Na+/alanine symporter